VLPRTAASPAPARALRSALRMWTQLAPQSVRERLQRLLELSPQPWPRLQARALQPALLV
jgi:hypothetical protein